MRHGRLKEEDIAFLSLVTMTTREYSNVETHGVKSGMLLVTLIFHTISSISSMTVMERTILRHSNTRFKRSRLKGLVGSAPFVNYSLERIIFFD